MKYLSLALLTFMALCFYTLRSENPTVTLKATNNTAFTDYEIVGATSLGTLRTIVKRDMDLRWQPIGGVAFDGKSYYQTMVK